VAGDHVQVEGLDELVKAFGRVDKGLRRELQKQLRVIGKGVVDQARAVAASEGLHGSGRDPHPGQLISKMTVSVRGGSVYVRDTAKTVSTKYPQGYNYPQRLEYEAGGSRSFLRRGLEERRGTVIRDMERLVDWIADEWGR
jgi:hypothetical protein